jgi:uncharacterized protein
MNEQTPAAEGSQRPFPFNNLYLISGLVHGQNKGWMYLFTFLFTLFGYFSYQLVIGYPLLTILRQNGYSEMELMNTPSLLFDSKALGLDRNLVLLLEMGMFVFALLGLYTGIRRLHQKPLVSVLTGYERFRYRRFWFSFAVWGSMIVLAVLISLLTAPEDLKLTFEPTGFLISALILLIFIPLQTGWEEVLFRGYLVQGLAIAFRSGIVPVIITSALFGAAHLGNPEVKQHGSAIMLTYYCGSALFLSCLTLIDEGIELAYGLHFANNLVSALLVSSPSSVLKPFAVFEATQEDAQAEVILWMCMAVAAFFIFWWRYRWKNFKLLIR